MRFYSLSENPNKPCYVLQFKQVSVMLDCGLDLSSWTHYLPLPGQDSKYDITTLQNTVHTTSTMHGG